MAKLKRLNPDDIVEAKAKGDLGFHPQLGQIGKGEVYQVKAGEFPHELLERPAGVLFPGEPDPDKKEEVTDHAPH
jgi:hypothetical protein